MSSFKKKSYTEPVKCTHKNDLTKDWYVFFQFKYHGKIFKFKRREGINRIKNLDGRINALEELLNDLQFDLRHGWNPILDRKREKDYNPYLLPKDVNTSKKTTSNSHKRKTKQEIYNFYFNR
jgi:hypothetical protein